MRELRDTGSRPVGRHVHVCSSQHAYVDARMHACMQCITESRLDRHVTLSRNIIDNGQYIDCIVGCVSFVLCRMKPLSACLSNLKYVHLAWRDVIASSSVPGWRSTVARRRVSEYGCALYLSSRSIKTVQTVVIHSLVPITYWIVASLFSVFRRHEKVVAVECRQACACILWRP